MNTPSLPAAARCFTRSNKETSVPSAETQRLFIRESAVIQNLLRQREYVALAQPWRSLSAEMLSSVAVFSPSQHQPYLQRGNVWPKSVLVWRCALNRSSPLHGQSVAPPPGRAADAPPPRANNANPCQV